MKQNISIGLGDFDPGTLPMDAFNLGGSRVDRERNVTTKAPWVFSAGVKVLSESTYTLEHGIEVVLVESADATTITIPEGLPVLRSLRVLREVAATSAVTVETEGSETIEGLGSLVTHGPYVASTLNNAEVTLRKVSETEWLFTEGVISGSNGGENWQRFPDGTELTSTDRWK